MTRSIAAAGLTVALATSAGAVSVEDFVGDSLFTEICNQGTSNQDCEFAVGEIRGGGNSWEIGVQNPPGTPVETKQFVWTNGSTESFGLAHDSGSGGLALILDPLGPTETVSRTSIGPNGRATMDTMVIRARSVDSGTKVELFDLALDGFDHSDNTQAPPDGRFLRFRGAGSAGAAYLRLGDFDWGSDWTLTGQVALRWTTPAVPNNANLDVNFKLTEIGQVPLPASLWLLLAGLAGLGALARRRQG